MVTNKKRFGRGIFKVLTGVVVGGAIGSILGLTLAPKKGKETRQAIRDKSMEFFLENKVEPEAKKMGFIKRQMIKMLTKKNPE